MPFQRYAQYASMILLLILIGNVLFPDQLPGFVYQIGTGLAILIGIAFLLNAGLMISDWRKDRLFIIRNTTFYTGILTVLVVIWFVYQDFSGRQGMGTVGWWLLPLLLFYYTQTLFRVRMDDMSLDLKLGLGKTVSMPLFDLEDVNITETSVEAKRVNGERFSLKRSFFTKRQWKILTERLSRLG